jgi:hypothetical protein
MPIRLGPAIAERRLVHVDDKRPVTVELGKPRRRRTGEWACPYRIRGLGRVRTRQAFGEDSIQALHLALELVRLELEPFRVQLGLADGEPGELFFPRYVPYYLGEKFARKLGDMMDREIHREGQRRRRRNR